MKRITAGKRQKYKGKHLKERRKRGLYALFFPDLFAKHMALDRRS